MQKLKIRQGIIKHVMIRKSFKTGDLMVIFSTQLNNFPNHKKTIIKTFIEKRYKFVLQMKNNAFYTYGGLYI